MEKISITINLLCTIYLRINPFLKAYIVLVFSIISLSAFIDIAFYILIIVFSLYSMIWNKINYLKKTNFIKIYNISSFQFEISKVILMLVFIMPLLLLTYILINTEQLTLDI